MSTGDERRAHPRLPIYSGNAEIVRVMGKGRRPSGRARIINWSRGGLCLRVPSPRRRFLFWKQPPAIFEEDGVTCTLRLPPTYSDLKIEGDVVRVERCKDDPDVLEVGLRFDDAQQVDAIAKILEPKRRTTSVRAPAADDKKSRRLTTPASAARASNRAAKVSGRAEALPLPGEGPPVKKKAPSPSQRLRVGETDTLQMRGDRQARQSGRLRP